MTAGAARSGSGDIDENKVDINVSGITSGARQRDLCANPWAACDSLPREAQHDASGDSTGDQRYRTQEPREQLPVTHLRILPAGAIAALGKSATPASSRWQVAPSRNICCWCPAAGSRASSSAAGTGATVCSASATRVAARGPGKSLAACTRCLCRLQRMPRCRGALDCPSRSSPSAVAEQTDSIQNRELEPPAGSGGTKEHRP